MVIAHRCVIAVFLNPEYRHGAHHPFSQAPFFSSDICADDLRCPPVDGICRYPASCVQTPEGVDGVLTALKELERLGYLERNQQRESNGRMGRAEYVIYEMPRKKPCTEKPYTVNPDTDTPVTENPAQLSTNRTSTETINKREKKEIQHRYG